jgi:methyl-accepting chemotaxis protein
MWSAWERRMSDLVEELYASDQASALTNRAARRIEAQAEEIEELRAALAAAREQMAKMANNYNKLAKDYTDIAGFKP